MFIFSLCFQNISANFCQEIGFSLDTMSQKIFKNLKLHILNVLQKIDCAVHRHIWVIYLNIFGHLFMSFWTSKFLQFVIINAVKTWKLLLRSLLGNHKELNLQPCRF